MFGAKNREITRLKRLLELRTDQRDDARQLADVLRGNTARVAQRYGVLGRIVAEHIVAAEHPGLKKCDAASMGIALAEALDAAGIDLSIEYDRLRKQIGATP